MMRSSLDYRRFALLAFMLVCVASCESKSHQDLVEFVDSTYKNGKPEIEPLPPIEPYEEFLYSASQLNDPFDSKNVRNKSSSQEGAGALQPDKNRRKEALEAYSIGDLRLDGVLEFRGKVSAIFRLPSGETISASAGNYIGKNNGKILSIDGDVQMVKVEELVGNRSGGFRKKIVTISGASSDK